MHFSFFRTSRSRRGHRRIARRHCHVSRGGSRSRDGARFVAARPREESLRSGRHGSQGGAQFARRSTRAQSHRRRRRREGNRRRSQTNGFVRELRESVGSGKGRVLEWGKFFYAFENAQMKVVMRTTPRVSQDVIVRSFLPLIQILSGAQFFEVRKASGSLVCIGSAFLFFMPVCVDVRF